MHVDATDAGETIAVTLASETTSPGESTAATMVSGANDPGESTVALSTVQGRYHNSYPI